jgi:hypothetical protein
MKQLGYLINGIEFIPQHIADKHMPFGQYPDQTIEVVWSLDDDDAGVALHHATDRLQGFLQMLVDAPLDVLLREVIEQSLRGSEEEEVSP